MQVQCRVCVSKQRTSDGKIVRKLKKLISARLNVVADSAARALGIKITKSVRKKRERESHNVHHQDRDLK